MALGPAAAEDRSYKVQDVTAEPCSSVSAATAPVSAIMVSKKAVSSACVVSKGMLPTYRRLAAFAAFSAAACMTQYSVRALVSAVVWLNKGVAAYR